MTRPSPERIKVIQLKIERVRSVLLAYWDPLDVGGNPELADEYDAYLGRVLTALENGASLEDMAAILMTAEADLLGSHGEHETRLATAHKLLALNDA